MLHNQLPTPEIYDWGRLPHPPDYPQDPLGRQQFQPWWWPWFRGTILIVILLALSFLLGRLTASLPPSHTADSSHVATRTLTTVQTFSGSNSMGTGDFVMHTAWQINWLCIPKATSKDQYSLKIDVNDEDTFSFVSTAADLPCKPDKFSGTVKEAQAGHFYLYITSTGPWAIEIQTFQ